MAGITLFAAFIGGIASFLSPCVLPLIPSFLAYLTGISIKENSKARLKIFLNSVAYVLGFSVVFSVLGILLNTILENVSYMVQLWLSRIGGIIIIFFGLYQLGLIRLDFLETEHRLKVKKFNISYITSFVFGASFAAGWTPCVGAVLGSVLALAAANPDESFFLLLAYSLGLGIPFLLTGLFSIEASALIKKFGSALKYFNIAVGIFLVILGILVFTQTLGLIANISWLNDLLLK